MQIVRFWQGFGKVKGLGRGGFSSLGACVCSDDDWRRCDIGDGDRFFFGVCASPASTAVRIGRVGLAT